MITYHGDKVTATQYAKLIVADGASMAEEYWFERQAEDVELMTERERKQIQGAITKQADRVYKLLDYWELREKLVTPPE